MFEIPGVETAVTPLPIRVIAGVVLLHCASPLFVTDIWTVIHCPTDAVVLEIIVCADREAAFWTVIVLESGVFDM